MAFGVISQITDQLYLSGVHPITLVKIRDLRITCIINVTLDGPNLPANAADIEFIRVRVDDSPAYDMSAYLDPVADKIHEVARRRGKTLVHCMAGVSRSPTLCLAYLMKYHRMRLRDAFFYLKSRRSVVHPNNGFFSQLISFENQLFGCTSVRMIEMPSIAPGEMIPDVYAEECKGLLWLRSLKSLNNPRL